MRSSNSKSSPLTNKLSADGSEIPDAKNSNREAVPVSEPVEEHPDRSSQRETIPEGGLAGLRAAKKTAKICLSARGLTKRYQGTVALSDVSLDLKKGEIFGLMGPNGAGKTTLLRILATLTKPDSGEFKLEDIPHTQSREIRRKIGFTNDVLGVYDDMLVGEYLEFFARASGVEIDLVGYAVDETLKLVDLLSMKNQPVDGLSRGMKQRLAFSRAIIAKPSLLLLDEPASGLDPLARLELKELLLRRAREGTTIIISSHVLEDLAEVSHRIGVLRNGILIKTAATQDLVKIEGSRRLRLRVSENGQELFEFLELREDVANLRWDDQELVFRWIEPESGGAHPGDPSEFLVTVVTAGYKVSSFTEEQASLENAYLHIAEHNKGKVVA